MHTFYTTICIKTFLYIVPTKNAAEVVRKKILTCGAISTLSPMSVHKMQHNESQVTRHRPTVDGCAYDNRVYQNHGLMTKNCQQSTEIVLYIEET